MKRCGIAIFVKTPGRSALKTRLAAHIGRTLAEQWYVLAARAVAAVARSVDAQPYWAVAESLPSTRTSWSDLPALPQGDGGLGARMRQVHEALIRKHGSGILLGADTPHLAPSALATGVEWLDDTSSARLMLGPAVDGGFWSFGANRKLYGAWEQVPYSQSNTAALFRTRFQREGNWKILDSLCDVDEAEDLRVCFDALRELSEPLPEQVELLKWMASHAVLLALDQQ